MNAAKALRPAEGRLIISGAVAGAGRPPTISSHLTDPTMATAIAATTLRTDPLANDDLLLREILHRSANDLQLVIGLLSFEARQAASADTRGALGAVAGRVAVLARVREAMQTGRQRNLPGTLRAVCAADRTRAGPQAFRDPRANRLDIGGFLERAQPSERAPSAGRKASRFRPVQNGTGIACGHRRGASVWRRVHGLVSLMARAGAWRRYS